VAFAGKRPGRKVDFLPKSFNVKINKAWCKGCGLCIGICPKKVLELDEQVKCEPVRLSDCIGCRQCENMCPDFAITVEESE
jgi:2-oxoglutarate ferredoxin oxidoreductase subunit delta